MKNVFVDTLYWVALIDPHDQWHKRAHAASRTLEGTKLFTTDTVLTEVMNYFSGEGEWLRKTGAANVRAILANSQIDTIFIERSDFLSGFDPYEARPDKGYSLTDCISINIMRAHRSRAPTGHTASRRKL